MVYYMYIRYTPSPTTWRYVVAAPDAETIDEWWREVKGKSGWDIKRLSSDFFTYGKGNWFAAAPSFNTRLLYFLMWDGGGRDASIFHNEPRSDPISGKSFYIRSKSDPKVYWYVTGENTGRVYASALGRTRFCIRVDGEKDSDETVMIKSDKITITKASNPRLIVGLNNGELYLSEQNCNFNYGDLKHRFLAQGETQPGGEARNTAIVTQCEPGIGEEWEIVS